MNSNIKTAGLAEDGIVTLFAGRLSGNAGSTGNGGPATSAKFSYPMQLALDSSNNLIIADSDNGLIRAVSLSTKILTDITQKNDLKSVMSVAIDSSGNIYGTDYEGEYIRKVSRNGDVSIFAGGGGRDQDINDGIAATSAKIESPHGIWIDNLDNVYYTDTNRDLVRIIDVTTNLVSTFAGGGTCLACSPTAATGAQLNYPTSIWVQSDGLEMVIADQMSHVIRKIKGGVITIIAGICSVYGSTGDGGPASLALLDLPKAAFGDTSGNIYIADTYNNKIRRISVITGFITTVVGGGSSDKAFGSAPTAFALSQPRGLVVDTSGNLYISDTNENRILLVSTKPSSGTVG